MAAGETYFVHAVYADIWTLIHVYLGAHHWPLVSDGKTELILYMDNPLL